MDRRNFFKIVSTVSAGVATSACGSKSNQLIPLLVSEHEIVPGEEQWHTAVCTECGAGCGTMARVMAGERVVERAGKQFRERIACVKKIEGNPADPVSGGHLCARGHAALQGIYNPDRLRGPMLRLGEHGKAEFKAVSWDEGIAVLAEKLKKVRATEPGKILFLSRPEFSARSQAIGGFLKVIGAPPARTASLDSFALERKAAEMVFGWQALPVYDLAPAHYVLSIGADFLGGWISPVYYARQFGQLRQGRPDIRGRLIHAESRMSVTAASADEWLPVRPGAEPQLVLALMRILLDAKAARQAYFLPTLVRESIESADLPSLIHATGLSEKKLRRVARELSESERPLVLAGASTVHSNSLDALVAAHYLNLMVGGTVKPGAHMPAPQGDIGQALQQARVLLLDGENPVYTLGASLGDKELIVSFSNFIDESAVFADVILPDHHSLEWEAAIVSPITHSVAVGEQFVQPLYNTRALAQTLADIAAKLKVPFVTQDIRAFAAEQNKPRLEMQVNPPDNRLQARAPQTIGAPEKFPFEFQPYISLQYLDGRGANLPWMQELPDPVSSAMWDLPAEIDPKTAAKLNIVNGTRIRISSMHGSIEAFAYVHPAALPGVISMAMGQGHTHYGRYASGRGANPLSILAPMWEDSTGVMVTGGTRVRLESLSGGSGEFIQFSPQDREQGPWGRS
jgi:anaerobic selenocysteine-containing dehydrogenase